MAQEAEKKYRIEFAASAAKEFRALPKDVQWRAKSAIDGLAGNPRPVTCRKLQGHQRLYRVRVGDYRLVYEINDPAKTVLITRIRHRREVYR